MAYELFDPLTLVPGQPTLAKVREAAEGCRNCDLWKSGTQTVFGEGPATADVLLVGEQPGNEEDLEGRPFVGPAGRVLDRGLEEAGIDRSRASARTAVPRHEGAWRAARGGAASVRRRHRASLVDPPRARRRRQARGDGGFRARPP
jgi:DNA polymerase